MDSKSRLWQDKLLINVKYKLIFLSDLKLDRATNKSYTRRSKCIKYILSMIHFKFFSHKVLLALSLGLVSAVSWSQETLSSQATPLENEDARQNAEQESSQDFNLSYVPIVFDPVLIQTIELSETDDNGEPRLDTIELSTLPSSNNLPPFAGIEPPQTDQSVIDFSLAQFQESIAEFEIDGGVYDFRLSELYLSLGNTYRLAGDFQLAIDSYNEALQLSRINEGLFTEDQVPIVEELVNSYLNLGDIESANLNQEYLLYVKQKIHGAGHPMILNDLLEYADWNLHATSLSMGYRPNFQSLYFRTQSFNERNYIQPETTENFLAAAAFAYTQALIMQHDLESQSNESYSSAETLQLKDTLGFPDEDYNISETEQKLAYTYFLQNQFDQNNIANNAFNEAPTTYFLDSYSNGRTALERRYAYLRDKNSPAIDIIHALLDIADWYLIFERWSSAEELYIQAFELMAANDIETINGLDYPDLPLEIPTFISSAYSRESYDLSSEVPLPYEGYIDLSFTISRFARPTRIRFISSSEGTNEATERALLEKVRDTKYRLQLTDRSEYAENTYLLRYYYTSQPEPPNTEEE